jgi:Cation transporting ATPase, C-terminus
MGCTGFSFLFIFLADIRDSNRQFDNTFNIFEGMHRNWMFIIVSLIMIGGQILIIFVGGQAFSVVPLSPAQWGCSVVLGVLSILVGCIFRTIPDELFKKLYASWNRFVYSLLALFGYTPGSVDDRC